MVAGRHGEALLHLTVTSILTITITITITSVFIESWAWQGIRLLGWTITITITEDRAWTPLHCHKPLPLSLCVPGQSVVEGV